MYDMQIVTAYGPEQNAANLMPELGVFGRLANRVEDRFLYQDAFHSAPA